MRMLLLLVLVIASFMVAGCGAIVGIFKAGVWTGVIMVAFAILIIGFIVAKIRT